MAEQSEYSFVVKGKTAGGLKAKLSGRVWADSPAEGRLAPASAFDAAVKAVQALDMGIVIDLSVGGNVVLRRLKGRRNG